MTFKVLPNGVTIDTGNVEEDSHVFSLVEPPFDRSPTDGFRCIQFLHDEPNLENLQRTIETPYRDFMSGTPVSDEVFAQYLRQFDYDRTPLEATVEEEIPVDHGVRQKVTFDAAYGGERMLAYLFLPTEPRIKANILYVAGLLFQHALPEADQMSYVTRVRQPTLILNGELDFFFPPETSQKPLYELLGTPDGDKKRLVFPGGHSVPCHEMMKESLQWLDKYLGPVE